MKPGGYTTRLRNSQAPRFSEGLAASLGGFWREALSQLSPLVPTKIVVERAITPWAPPLSRHLPEFGLLGGSVSVSVMGEWGEDVFWGPGGENSPLGGLPSWVPLESLPQDPSSLPFPRHEAGGAKGLGPTLWLVLGTRVHGLPGPTCPQLRPRAAPESES